jgi:hypothetical protein
MRVKLWQTGEALVIIQFHHTESLIYTVPFVIYGIFPYNYSLHQQTMASIRRSKILRDQDLLLAIARMVDGHALWLIS